MGELYRTDLVLWSAQQAAALRAAAREGSNAAVDWENVAEEIESLGASERRTLASHIRTVIEHLMKLDVSPAPQPRAEWYETIARARNEIEIVLEDSPSLRRELLRIIARGHDSARRIVRQSMSRWDDDTATLDALTYDEVQVLSDWFPGSKG